MVRRMNRRSPRSFLSVVAVAAMSLILAGCFSMESTYTINDDATADVEFVVLIDTEQLGMFAGMLGEDVGDLGDLSGEALIDEMMGEMMGGDDPCGDLTESLPGYDVETSEVKDGSKAGVRCKVIGVPLDELNSSMDDPDSTFVVEQDDDGTKFSATLAGVDELAGDDADDMSEMFDMNLDEMFEIVFVVSAPGSLGDNNATSTSGSTATWKITGDADFVTNGDAQMTAEWTGSGSSSSSSSSSTMWIILGIIAAVVVIGAIIFFAKRGKGGTSDTGSATPPAVPVTPGAAPVAPGAAPLAPPPIAGSTPPPPPPPPA